MFDYLLQVGNKEIWNPKTDNNLVKKMMRNNDVQVTRMLVEQTGALYDATIYKASVTKSESYVPLKSSDAILSDVKKIRWVYKYKKLLTTVFSVSIRRTLKNLKLTLFLFLY